MKKKSSYQYVGCQRPLYGHLSCKERINSSCITVNDQTFTGCNMLILTCSFGLFNFRLTLIEILIRLCSLALLNKKVATIFFFYKFFDYIHQWLKLINHILCSILLRVWEGKSLRSLKRERGVGKLYAAAV